MNYWLHRISHVAELSYPLLDRGYLTIGFSDFSYKEMIDCVLEDDWAYFNQQFQDFWGRIPRPRYSLWNFLKMSKGDLVIVPSQGTFAVCEIIDQRPLLIAETFSEDLKSWDGKPISTNGIHLISPHGNAFDLGFARKVKILYKQIPRDKFADAQLTARMKIRQTNAAINDLKTSIETSIENFIANKPIHLHALIIDKTANFVLDTIQNELNPDKFEKLIQAYFKTIGATEVAIPAKNGRNKEGDADIVAVFEPIKLIIYTQAKFQKGQINEWGTNQILDYKTNQESIADGYNKVAWVITTANTFNERAENLAKENEVQLINGLEFSKMLLNAGIRSMDTFL
ncbi:restriction endonuclease [Mongoliitalea daihaiensis]|uniref:restriction endonuclease n=1 Tax=Mongoliitalea daihaiensis TaxID=2782006 RepID=UPI001F2D9A96|nr:restriction endonuclease [Mongoliitalea daihaiensis]UJP64799.1 restriction endonuclease [Mongoliitalea daihaiensis]